MDQPPFATLHSLEAFYRDEPSVHRQIYDACTTAMAQTPALLRHRRHIEENHLGFGDRAFHWLWKLIVDVMPSHFRFLEIGVYKGQVISLVSMLAMHEGKTSDTIGVTPLGAFGDRFSNYPDDDYLAAIRSMEEWCRLSRGYRARIIPGFSDDYRVIW
jgi:hypothetical protein